MSVGLDSIDLSAFYGLETGGAGLVYVGSGYSFWALGFGDDPSKPLDYFRRCLWAQIFRAVITAWGVRFWMRAT